MKIKSSVFTDRGKIPIKYTGDGEEINPPLVFEGIPKDSKSLVLIIDDPDVPKYLKQDGLWIHWLVYDLDPSVQGINENSTPKGTVGQGTDQVKYIRCYQGPKPPDSEHRYFFKLYALNKKTNLPPGASIEEVKKAMEGAILEEATLTGLYGPSIAKK